MNPSTVEMVKFAAQITSTAVAVVALIIGLRNEFRNQKRFETQLSQSRKIAEAAARPILDLSYEIYRNKKGLILENHGPGTAIITKVSCFRRGRKPSTDLERIFDLGRDVLLEEATDFTDEVYYVPPKSSEPILLLTANGLKRQKKSPEQIGALLAELEKQINEFEMLVSYEDVLGNVIRENARLTLQDPTAMTAFTPEPASPPSIHDGRPREPDASPTDEGHLPG